MPVTSSFRKATPWNRNRSTVNLEIAEASRDGARAHQRVTPFVSVTAARATGRLKALVAPEQRCCSFLEFNLIEGDDEIRLGMIFPPEAEKLLSLFPS